MSDRYRVANSSEVQEGNGKTFEVAGKTIAVFHFDDGFYALDNACPHCNTGLDRGVVLETAVTFPTHRTTVMEHTVTCPLHGWHVDVVRGTCPISPDERFRTYPVEVEGDELYVVM